LLFLQNTPQAPTRAPIWNKRRELFEKEYMLGIDIGTSSLKVCAVDCRGSKLGERKAGYPTLVPHAGWAEQNPDEWVGALTHACRHLLEDSALAGWQVFGISLSSAAHIAVLLDKENKPLRNAILWLDQRSHRQAARLAEGLVFHPYLSGERCPYWDNRLRASFTGLSFQHNLPHIARAVYEGCAFSIKDAMAMLSTFSGKAESVSLIGGGAKSKLWSSIVCNVLGVDIVRTPEVDSSYGAALLGLYGLGVYADIRDAQRCAHFGGEHMIPDKETHTLYQSIFRIYRKIQQAMQPIYH